MNPHDDRPPRSRDLLPLVRAAAEELTSEERAGPLLVGVSGGPDSLALLHLLWRWSRDGGPALRAIHVDHGWRASSSAAAATVARSCRELGVPCASHRLLPHERDTSGGRELAAREARYRRFAAEVAATGARVLALAHHADDQAETLLLHLMRGAGLAGLSGMPIVRRSGDLFDRLLPGAARPAVWRPLLTVDRAAISAYCQSTGLQPLADESNDDLRLRRNAVRQRLLPAIEAISPGASRAIARNARLLAADEAFLQQQASVAWSRCVREASEIVVLERAVFMREDPAIQRRLLRQVWRSLVNHRGTIGLTAEPVEAASAAIGSDAPGGRWMLPAGVALVLDRDVAVFGPEGTVEETLRQQLDLPTVAAGWRAALPAEGAVILNPAWQIAVDRREAVTSGPGDYILTAAQDDNGWLLRTWEPGDRVILANGRRRKLQDWFVDQRVPRYARAHLVLLARGQQVAWIAGLAAFLSEPPGESLKPAGQSLHLLYNRSPITLCETARAAGEGETQSPGTSDQDG